jgi:hypothetical protein
MKKIPKICLATCLLLILVPAVMVVIAGALFLHGLEFPETERTRIVDTTTRLPASLAAPARVRLAAESEPALGALVSWPLAVPESLVVEIAEDDTLFLLVQDETKEAEAARELVEWGFDALHLPHSGHLGSRDALHVAQARRRNGVFG